MSLHAMVLSWRECIDKIYSTFWELSLSEKFVHCLLQWTLSIILYESVQVLSLGSLHLHWCMDVCLREWWSVTFPAVIFPCVHQIFNHVCLQISLICSLFHCFLSPFHCLIMSSSLNVSLCPLCLSKFYYIIFNRVNGSGWYFLELIQKILSWVPFSSTHFSSCDYT